MSFAGSYGVPRRTYDSDFTGAILETGFDPVAHIMLGVLGIGAILAFTGLLLFVGLVIFTSFYASCSQTCPLIMEQVKEVLDNLSEKNRENVVLLAVTMDPEKDEPEILQKVADFYKLTHYQHHLLTGDKEAVAKLLDFMGVLRSVDEETGIISHVNLFLIRDFKNKIAFKFSLGEFQAEWMTEVINLLLHEKLSNQVVAKIP